MKIAFKETNDVQLIHPVTGDPLFTDAGKPMLVEIYGKHTKTVKNAGVRLRKAAAKKKPQPGKTQEEIAEENAISMLVECVASFKNLEIDAGEGYGVLNADDIRGVLDVFWIREQVDQAIVDLENFTVAPSTS